MGVEEDPVIERIGVIAFAFGQQETHTAGPSNEAISQIALAVVDTERAFGNEVYLATQWETALYCDERSEHPDVRVSEFGSPATHYIDTKGVLDSSIRAFAEHGVQRLVFVAHPLHLFFIRLLVATKIWSIGNATVVNEYHSQMQSIPYDTSPGNRQSWTRGPFVFIAYLAKTLVTGRHGT